MEKITLANFENVEPRIKNSLWLRFQKEGTVTGSYIFGEWNELYSDIDIMLPPDFMSFNDLLQQVGGRYSGDYAADGASQSMYFINRDNELINAILFNDWDEYHVWCKATQWMKVLYKTRIVKKMCQSRKVRLILFKALRDIASIKLKPKDDVPF